MGAPLAELTLYRTSKLETGALLAVLAALAVTVLLPSALDAGFVADDWANAEAVKSMGYADAARDAVSKLGSKPLLGVLLPVPYALFGTTHGIAHVTVALTLGVVTSAVLYLVLRELSFERWAAGAAAALALVFPWNDSARYWLTASINQVALVAYLAGVLLAFRALAANGRRAVALHAASVAGYVAAVLVYEVPSALVLATGAVYFTRADRRRALGRWAVDIVVAGAAIVWSLGASVKDQASIGDQIDNARQMTIDGARLAGRAVIPVVGAGEIAAIVVAMLLLASAQRLRRRPDAPEVGALRSWILRGACAAAATALSWAAFVPAAYWTPLKPGLENRVNVLATLPLAVAVVALAHVAGLVLAGGHAVRARAVTFAVLAVIGAGYAVQIADSGDAWRRAGEAREAALVQIDEAIGVNEDVDRIYLVGTADMTAPGVPVFVFSYDLWGAVRVDRDDFTVAAHPALAGARLECAPDGVRALRLPSPTYEFDLVAAAGAMSPYGATWIVDAGDGGAVRLDDRRTCAAYLRSHDLD